MAEKSLIIAENQTFSVMLQTELDEVIEVVNIKL